MNSRGWATLGAAVFVMALVQFFCTLGGVWIAMASALALPFIALGLLRFFEVEPGAVWTVLTPVAGSVLGVMIWAIAQPKGGDPLIGRDQRERDGDDQQRIEKHRAFARAICGQPASEQSGKQETAGNRANRRHRKNNRGRLPDLRLIKAELQLEEIGCPKQHEPPDHIGRHLCPGHRPCPPITQQFAPRRTFQRRNKPTERSYFW